MFDKKRLMNTVFPSLVFKDSKKAIEFYSKVFGAIEAYRYEVDNKIMHAEIVLNSNKTSPSSIMLGDEMPEMGYVVNNGGRGLGINLYVYVDDVDKIYNLAIANGSQSLYPPHDQFYGDRVGAFIDPFGYEWSVAKHIKDVPLEQMYIDQKKQEKEMAKLGNTSHNAAPTNYDNEFYRQKLEKYKNKYDDLIAKISGQINNQLDQLGNYVKK